MIKNKIPSISFAITVCDEHDELKTLLSQIIPFVKENDEIVIQVDETNSTLKVREVIEEFQAKHSFITHVMFPLNGDFASFKNNLKKACTKEFIFQIDADETLGTYLLLVHDYIATNPESEAFWIPRLNTVKDLELSYAQSIGWNVDHQNQYEGCPVINWPDLQLRIFRNLKRIKWAGKVHEKVVGYKIATIVSTKNIQDVTANRKLGLIHEKTFAKQMKQNNFYLNITK